MVSQADLDVYQGDTFVATVTVTNEDNTPATITGYSALAQIRRAVADADTVIVATITAVVASPYVNLSLTAAQTASLTGNYVWDLQLTAPAGGIITILRGKVIVTPEVSRIP